MATIEDSGNISQRLERVERSSDRSILEERIQALRDLVDAKDRALRDLVDALRRQTDERDRLYQERDEFRRVAVDAALIAAKEQVQAAFEASEKAIVKAENAQREYNIRSNEFRGQLEDQAKRLISRPEVEILMKGQEEKGASQGADIRQLREQIVAITASKLSSREGASDSRAWISVALAIASFIMGLVLAAGGFIAARM